MSQFQIFGPAGGGAIGDVVGPASSTDNAVVRFDGTTGKLIQNSNATLSDAGVLSLALPLAVGSGGLGITSTPTNGQIPIGNGTNYVAANITSSGGTVTITNGAGTINLEAGLSFTWNTIAGTSQNMAVNQGYVPLNVGITTLTLPATAAVGSIIRVAGYGSGGWTVAQNAGQTIYFGTFTSTTGAGGSLFSTHSKDSIELLCVVANTDFVIISSIGNITVI